MESPEKISKNCCSENPDNERLLHDSLNKNSELMNKNEPFCFLNIFKPRGTTSFDVIYKLRKRLKIKKIGHSGTLDPEAEGVMQVAVGKATRLLDYLGSDKKYIAKVKFGYFSSTADAEGDIVQFNVPNFDYERLLSAINSMIGQIEQVPPAFSAVKVGGKKLCDLARKKKQKSTHLNSKITTDSVKSIKNTEIQLNNKVDNLNGVENGFDLSSDTAIPGFKPNLKCLQTSSNDDLGAANYENPSCAVELDVLFKNINNELAGVEIPKRTVKIYDAKLLNFVTIPHPDNPEDKIPYEAEIEIYCSKGTYIRSFAVDLARKLGTCAYLTSLTRILAGKFDIKSSVQIDEVFLDKHGIKPSQALGLPCYELNEDELFKTLNGVSFYPVRPVPDNEPLMLIHKNNLVSIAVLSDNKIVCKKVFK